jgi:hypothetical protein
VGSRACAAPADIERADARAEEGEMTGAWRRGRRTVAFFAVGAVTLALAAPASASVATTLRLTSSAATVPSAGSATLTATIVCAPGGPGTAPCSQNGSQGSLKPPGGPNVTFTDATNGNLIATVPVSGSCTPKGCVVKTMLSGSALAPGPNKIVAVYSGQPGESPSSDSTTVLGGPGAFTTTCALGGSLGGLCDSLTQTSPDGSGSIDIATAPPASGTEIVSGFWSSQPLPCSGPGTVDTTPGAGNIPVFSVTNPGGPKTITYTVFGTYAVAAAINAANALAKGAGVAPVCYESTQPFTDANGNPAQLDPVTGLFFGELPACRAPDAAGTTNTPCVVSSSPSGSDADDAVAPDADDPDPTSYIDVVLAPQDDPRIGNG